jgi:hypothetical protein
MADGEAATDICPASRVLPIEWMAPSAPGPSRLLSPMFRPPVRSVVFGARVQGTRCGAVYLDFLAADRWSAFAVS